MAAARPRPAKSLRVVDSEMAVLPVGGGGFEGENCNVGQKRGRIVGDDVQQPQDQLPKPVETRVMIWGTV